MEIDGASLRRLLNACPKKLGCHSCSYEMFVIQFGFVPRSFPGRTRPGNFMRHYAPCVAAVCNAVRELFSDPADLVSCHSLCAQGDILTVLETLLRAVSNFSLL